MPTRRFLISTTALLAALPGIARAQEAAQATSAGPLAATASFFAPNNATFTGQLFQTTGPSNPAFADLSYGGNPVACARQFGGHVTQPGRVARQGRQIRALTGKQAQSSRPVLTLSRRD